MANLEKKQSREAIKKSGNGKQSKKRLHTVFSSPDEQGSFNKNEAREYKDECIEDVEETDACTKFLRIQKNHLADLMQHCSEIHQSSTSIWIQQWSE